VSNQDQGGEILFELLNKKFDVAENAFAAIVRAIHNATSNWFKEQPVTPEKIAMTLKKKEGTLFG